MMCGRWTCSHQVAGRRVEGSPRRVDVSGGVNKTTHWHLSWRRQNSCSRRQESAFVDLWTTRMLRHLRVAIFWCLGASHQRSSATRFVSVVSDDARAVGRLHFALLMPMHPSVFGAAVCALLWCVAFKETGRHRCVLFRKQSSINLSFSSRTHYETGLLVAGDTRGHLDSTPGETSDRWWVLVGWGTFSVKETVLPTLA